MDFVKKFAEEQFEKQMGGGQGQNQQNQNQHQGGFGGQGGQGEFGVTGGPQYNAPHGQGGVSIPGAPSIDQGAAIQAANEHAGNGNDNASLFSQAFNMIGGMNKHDTDIDENDVQNKHQEAYEQGRAGNMSAGAMGSAAAMQALKQFTSGSSGASGGSGGNMQSKIMGMAMSEAAKLFDQSGGAASGDKQDAMTSAGQTMMKLMLKNQVSGMIGGGQSGGLSGLMGMASKFMA